MTKCDERTFANMEVALEKACRKFPNGGDHESRKYIAHRLRLSAKKGNTSLGELTVVAHQALRELRSELGNQISADLHKSNLSPGLMLPYQAAGNREDERRAVFLFF